MTHPTSTIGAPYTPHSDAMSAPEAPETPRWTLAHLLGFRFAFIYFLLYTFPGPVPVISQLLEAGYGRIWKLVVPWVGAHVLHLSKPISLQASGSGDKLFDWVQILVMLAIAASAAVIWTVRARETRNHRKLQSALSLYLRFYLAATLFGYGFDKIFPNQFEPMNPARLTQYFGEAAPGGFAWFFLGSSVMYEVFAGVGEVVAGAFMLFRRTATLGAFIGAAVMTNVFMLNMSYDIPVKQYSGHLLLMCCFLVACDSRRLLDVFIRNRPTSAHEPAELFTTPSGRRVARMVGIALAFAIVGMQVAQNYQFLYLGRLGRHQQVYGIFDTESVTKNGLVQPMLMTDATLWRRLATGNRGTNVRLATDSLIRYRMIVDSVKHETTFFGVAETVPKFRFAYALPDSMHLVLSGRMGPDSVEMKFRRRPESSYLLVNRGFHWINEVPYFR